MGTCYICGKQHVNYRREVNVGNSIRNSFSSKGRSSTSIGSYYGKRTVCAKCALDIDYSNQMKMNIYLGMGIFGIIVIFILPIIGIMNENFINMCICSALILIPSVILIDKGQKKAKKKADIWYQENKDKYIDEIDIQMVDDPPKIAGRYTFDCCYRRNVQRGSEGYACCSA